MTAQSESLAELAIKAVDWQNFELFAGPADGFGEKLAAFVASTGTATRADLWDTMENQVFAQDDIFSAAAPAIGVLLAAMAESRPLPVRISILDLLFHIAHAASLREDDFGSDCLSLMAEGGWLLVREGMIGESVVTEACLDVLDLCAPGCARLLRSASELHLGEQAE